MHSSFGNLNNLKVVYTQIRLLWLALWGCKNTKGTFFLLLESCAAFCVLFSVGRLLYIGHKMHINHWSLKQKSLKQIEVAKITTYTHMFLKSQQTCCQKITTNKHFFVAKESHPLQKSGIFWKSFTKRWPHLVQKFYRIFGTYIFLNKRYEIRLTSSPPFVKKFHKIPLFF